MAQERLQKLIAQAGVASRRAAEALITEGRVRVNGKVVTQLGAKADPIKDKIEVDGRRTVAEKPAYYLLHKPRGVVTTLDDPEGRDTIMTVLKGVTERVFPVGRLDYHTSGVMLVTNDGAMAQALLHPKKTVPKTYVAKVRGHLDVPQLDLLRNGVEIGGGETTRKAEVFVLREDKGNSWLSITITEGRNRQVHRMVEAVGSRVGRLARVSFAGLTLEGLRPGDYREVTSSEMQKLKRDYLNPQKRAIAAEVRREALDSAMLALGFDPNRDDGSDDDFGDEEGPPRAPFKRGKGPSKGPTKGPRGADRRPPRRDGRAAGEGGARGGRADSGRPAPGPAVEVVTVRRRSTLPPPDRTSPPELSFPRPSKVPQTGPSRGRGDREKTIEIATNKKRTVRKVVTPRMPVQEEKPPAKKAARKAASKTTPARRKKS